MNSVSIIAGLGNPGASYVGTRHNVGFAVLDAFAERCGAIWKPDSARKGLVARGPGVLLVKPQTFMNDSGVCVGALMRYFKFTPDQVLVVYDDIALPVGTLRLREGGSAGGHNGMKSVIAHLGTESFPRLRVGIGSHGGKSLVSHVLGGFTPEEKAPVQAAVKRAAEALQLLLQQGFSAAANRYNTPRSSKVAVPPSPDKSESRPEPEQKRPEIG